MLPRIYNLSLLNVVGALGERVFASVHEAPVRCDVTRFAPPLNAGDAVGCGQTMSTSKYAVFSMINVYVIIYGNSSLMRTKMLWT